MDVPSTTSLQLKDIVAPGALCAVIHAALWAPTAARRRDRVPREHLGRAVLPGLEFLIAGDIIQTVVVDPALVNVLALGLIVLIRTFLSTTLQLEIDSRWPWQRPGADAAASGT